MTNVSGSDSEGEDASTNVTHSDAAVALDIALRYVEQHAAATPLSLIHISCLRMSEEGQKFKYPESLT